MTRSDSPEFELKPMSRHENDQGDTNMKKFNSQSEDTLLKLMDGISDIESIKNGGVLDNIRWRKSSDGQQDA